MEEELTARWQFLLTLDSAFTTTVCFEIFMPAGQNSKMSLK